MLLRIHINIVCTKLGQHRRRETAGADKILILRLDLLRYPSLSKIHAKYELQHENLPKQPIQGTKNHPGVPLRMCLAGFGLVHCDPSPPHTPPCPLPIIPFTLNKFWGNKMDYLGN